MLQFCIRIDKKQKLHCLMYTHQRSFTHRIQTEKTNEFLGEKWHIGGLLISYFTSKTKNKMLNYKQNNASFSNKQ